ncbi:putative cytochrome P450 [Mycena indigotica]|uniref:Putative cytochrome P450 n=1 Tax=Mycena indigotica TaxID=2126181 RepID=A0A8H6ST41_9AGAR|nr:putative cytochrome P450 [Mycena indigotica]KAF7303882.1 putative cytochrome P450 [Mycena indigotica]
MSALYAYAIVSFLLFVFFMRKVGSRELHLPTGPPTIPLIGNLHIFPTEFAHYKFTEWARKYGGIYSLKLGPGTVVVLTDPAAVKELMDKRSSSTADRPSMFVADLVAGGRNMVLARYGGLFAAIHIYRSLPFYPAETWRTLRRASRSVLTPQASVLHLPIQQAESIQLLYDFYRKPEDFYTHLRRYSSSVILSVLYGVRSPRYETQATAAFFESQHEWERVLEPGATPPVDLIPILKYVPQRWAKWKRDCAKTRQLQRTLYVDLLEQTARRLARGEENGSYMEDILHQEQALAFVYADLSKIRYLGGALVEGGSDTTSSFLQSLVLVLAAFPDAQKKAQEEMDRIVGTQRLPSLKDLDDLHYIRALILETHRFRPVAPLMVPHATLRSEQYGDYFIPSGATIFVNTWGIFHDPALFDAPETFNPDRYILTEHGTKPGVQVDGLRPSFPFGVGRRICPGINIAQNSININTLNLVWAFNFQPPLDDSGKEIDLDLFDYQRGILTAPSPFECRIQVRTPHKANLIKQAFLEATDTFAKFEFGLSAQDEEHIQSLRAEAAS